MKKCYIVISILQYILVDFLHTSPPPPEKKIVILLQVIFKLAMK